MIGSNVVSLMLSAGCIASLSAWAVVGHAETTTIVLFSPSVDVQQQGWDLAGVRGEVKGNETFTTFNTIGQGTFIRQMFHRALPIYVEDGYVVDFWLKVNDVEVPPGATATGVTFYPGTITPRDPKAPGGLLPMFTTHRQMIYFNAGGFGVAGYYWPMDTTDNFHHYRFEVTATGDARVSVDSELRLTFDGFKFDSHIAFGDPNELAGGDGNFSLSGITVTGLIATPVPVDVRPSDCPNPVLNGESKKSVPIAVLGTPDFDVTKVDPTTIKINGLAPKGWAIRDAGSPVQPYLSRTEFDPCISKKLDKRNDLVLAFTESDLVQAIKAYPYYGLPVFAPVEVRVSGKLKPEFGNKAFAGDDLVEIRNFYRP